MPDEKPPHGLMPHAGVAHQHSPAMTSEEALAAEMKRNAEAKAKGTNEAWEQAWAERKKGRKRKP